MFKMTPPRPDASDSLQRPRPTLRALALVLAALARTASAQPASPPEEAGPKPDVPAASRGTSPDAVPAGLPATAPTPRPEVTGDDDKVGTETGILPLIGGDTDNGFGVGAIGSVANFDGKSVPYKWQLQFATFIATKSSPLSPSYEDAFINLIMPQLFDGRLRLEIRPSFTHETALRYYGLGNEIVVPATTDTKRDFYTRLHPQLQILTRWKLSKDSRWSVLAATQYLYNRISYDPSSTLAMDPGAYASEIAKPHSVLRIETGLVYDSRDNELAPNSGMFHSFEIRMSPHLGSAFPHQYEQADLQLRFYRTLSRRNVLAFRIVGDFQLGHVPFYETARYEDTSAIGGSLAVRGVPGYEFYGKVKVFGNLELRTRITRFNLWNRKFKLGMATFLDAGRMWSDLRFSRPDLDGTGLGLHYGTGVGFRLQQGRAFLVRADIAYSPDAHPIAGYVLADHIF